MPLKVTVGDRDVTGRFGHDGVGLIDGLDNGPNVVTATLDDGRGARITITNHPIGGPVFAGAQVQPWICQPGAKDAQCNRPAVVSYQYKDATSGSFSSLRPEEPAGGVAASRRRRPTRARRFPTSSAWRTACRTAAPTRSPCSTPPGPGTTSC